MSTNETIRQQIINALEGLNPNEFPGCVNLKLAIEDTQPGDISEGWWKTILACLESDGVLLAHDALSTAQIPPFPGDQ